MISMEITYIEKTLTLRKSCKEDGLCIKKIGIFLSTCHSLQNSEDNRACWSQDGVFWEDSKSDGGQPGFGCPACGPHF